MPNYQIIGRDGRSRFVDLRGDEDVTKVLEDGERLFVPHQFMDAVPSDPYEVTDAMLNEIENAHQEMVEVTSNRWKLKDKKRDTPHQTRGMILSRAHTGISATTRPIAGGTRDKRVNLGAY